MFLNWRSFSQSCHRLHPLANDYPRASGKRLDKAEVLRAGFAYPAASVRGMV